MKAAIKTSVARISAVVALTVIPTIAKPAVILDQSFTDPAGIGFTSSVLVGFGSPRLAQTFTAGVDGMLVSLNLDVFDDVPLRIAIYDTVEGEPGSHLFGEVTVPGPVTFDTLITFSEPLPLVAGKQYVIVVSQPETVSAAAFWLGLFGPPDLYPGGKAWSFTVTNANQGLVWVSYDESNGYFEDLHFRTFVEALPIADLVPCTGPHEGGTWNNHGDYVTAIENAVEHYEQIGVLTREEASRALTAAANSNCGKK